MAIIMANTVRPSVNRRLDDTTFGAGTFSWQDTVHSWKAGPGEVMTVENLFIIRNGIFLKFPQALHSIFKPTIWTYLIEGRIQCLKRFRFASSQIQVRKSSKQLQIVNLMRKPREIMVKAFSHSIAVHQFRTIFKTKFQF